MTDKPRPARSAGTYLAAIYLLAEEGTEPIQARLVDRLGHTAAAVSEMVGRLRDAGLVTRSGPHLVLTAAGMSRAEVSIRRHRLAERLLTDIIGVNWTTAHREASRWEQVISDDVEERLMNVLGHPTTSSLGTPIPGSTRGDGIVARPLRDGHTGEHVEIAQLTEALQADVEVIAYLAGHGLSPGAPVTIESKAPDGTLTIRTDQSTLAVIPSIARQIAIRATNDEATMAKTSARRPQATGGMTRTPR